MYGKSVIPGAGDTAPIRKENFMIELINTLPQTVAAGQSVAYDSTAVKSGRQERHREGSSQILLNGPGRWLVGFSGNIAVPTGGTVEEITLGITYNGEVLGGSLMRATPAAVEEFFNVSTQHYVDVPCSCCVTITAANPGTQAIVVDNPNLIAVRVC